jgi:hypothetical protein
VVLHYPVLDRTQVAPTSPPKCSETMKEFVKWVQADAARKNEAASVGFIRFMSERFPCKS